MAEPPELLQHALERATASAGHSLIADPVMQAQVEYVARTLKNRAGVRLLMACLLAKLHLPEVDVRQPYTQIGPRSFSGRTYDEQYLTPFILAHNLPCNPTTAFLTPALRNRNETLVRGLNLVGRPPHLYETVLDLLDEVHQGRVEAGELLAEAVRWLLVVRDERQARIEALVAGLATTAGALPLSSEQIVTLVTQHLRLKGTSRLPVLIVAAAYHAAAPYLAEQVRPLHTHNAADLQTGALGDVEITLVDEARVVTSYEMKDRRVTHEDIQRALQKVAASGQRVDNYLFITTEEIEESVQDYARSLYEETGGIEFMVLDCTGFLRHYLHLFHRVRASFLEAYQSLMLTEPESAVSQPVKEAFLSMRQAAEME